MRVTSAYTSFSQRIPARYRFVIFLGAALLIGLIMTGLSYELYIVSGAAQLDLSRPGYKQALQEVGTKSDDNVYDYSAAGPLDKKALDEFRTKYNKLLQNTKGYSAYDAEALSDEQLNLSQSTPPSPQ